MTRCDFHVLGSAQPGDGERHACQVIEKAWSLGHRVYVHAADADQARRLDDLLWTFRQGSFIPHGLYTPDPGVPVQIGWDSDPGDHHDVLLNLAPTVPPFFARFARVVEIVAGGDSERQQGRERYRHYRDRGYELATHEVGLRPPAES